LVGAMVIVSVGMHSPCAPTTCTKKAGALCEPAITWQVLILIWGPHFGD
jgi:hypothetical protein